MEQTATENIRDMDFGEFFKRSFYGYGMSVIEERALPDVRDGLKPVNRAIIYEILKSGVTSASKPTKVARISGNVIGNWHPHGDKAVEDALAGMAAPWANTLPTVLIKGNGGSIFGDGAAAGRYIEARLTPAGDAYGYKMKEGIVPYVPNFDNTGKMPTILPAQLPYLLLNGIKEGIAVGVAASMPPHNAREVLAMTLAYLKNPKIKTAELLEYMPGPDFPSGATIINKDDMLEIYKTGYGKIMVRATVEYDKKEHALHVREIPYTFAGSMDNLVKELADATTERQNGKHKIPPKVKDVNAVHNYSGKAGIDICLELAHGKDPDEILNNLYAKTRLETSVKFIFNALNGREMHSYSLKQYLAEYAQFQHEIVGNEYKLEITELSRRLEVIMGRIIASMYVDEIVDTVKNSESRTQVKDMLMHGTILPGTDPRFHEKVATFAFTEIQADAIADCMLYQLNRMDVVKLKEEGLKVQEKLKYAERIVSDYGFRHQLIIDRLKAEYDKLPACERKTRIISDRMSKSSEKDAPAVARYIAIDKYNYVRLEAREFEGSTATDSKARIGFFDTLGNCWNLFLDRTKETKDRGTLVQRLISLEGTVVGMTASIGKEGAEGLFLFEDGAMKRVDMSRFMTKTRATKINTRTAGQPLKKFVDIPADKNIVCINGVDIPLSEIPLQSLSGGGRVFTKDGSPLIWDESQGITFKLGDVKEMPKPSGRGKQNDVFDAVAMFMPDGRLLFDWTTLDTKGKEGLYVTTYQELLKQRLLFVHDDGTAKWVSGEQFEVKTRRTQVVADKEGTASIYIGPFGGETMVGTYEGNRKKRVKVEGIATQGKTGGGVRVFHTPKYKLLSVGPGDGSSLPIVSFATLPKEVPVKTRAEKAQDRVLDSLDYVMEVHETPDYVEVIGKTGGDVLTFRVMDDGTVYER